MCADHVSKGGVQWDVCVRATSNRFKVFNDLEKFCHGVEHASQRTFGCLWRVVCDSHGPARWKRLFYPPFSSHVHVVVVLHFHVRNERDGARAW